MGNDDALNTMAFLSVPVPIMWYTLHNFSDN